MKRLILCSKASQSIPKLKEMINRLVPNGKLVSITTAANIYAPDNRPWFDEDITAIKDLGFEYSELDLHGTPALEIKKILQDANVIYASGGSAFYLLEQINQPHVRDIILDAINNGKLYIGSSAGAIVLCPDIEYIDGLDKHIPALADFTGLNVVPFRVMPHIDNPKYTSLMAERLPRLKVTGLNLIGLKDNQVIYMEDQYMEMFA